MKKFFLTIVATLFTAIPSFAQDLLVATLSHGEDITAYYGSGALKEAVEAAVNGDIITLSSGSFAATEINKAITVRGAGITTNNGNTPTVIIGDFYLFGSDEPTTDKIVLEGLYHNHTVTYDKNINAQFIKCRFNKFVNRVNPYHADHTSMSFIQCRVNSNLNGYENCMITGINSYINGLHSQNLAASLDMHNCVISYNSSYIYYSQFTNCILVPSSSSLGNNNTAYNCIAVGNSNSSFFDNTSTSNSVIGGYDMFKTWNGTWDDDADFILTDEAAKQYLGTDGTQVGIYGGSMPYNTITNNPQITKFDVATKTSTDGKLNVNIQVNSPK